MMGYGTNRNRVLQPTALVIAVTTFLVIPICLAQLDFIWDVEPWSPCEHASCGPGGRQYRKVWCKLMTGQPVVDFNCEQDFKPAQERQCEKPCVENVNLEQTSVNSFETTLDTHTSDFSPSDRLERSRSRESQGLGDTESSRGGFRPTYPLSQAASDVEWVVDQWSSCSLVPGADSCGRNSGVQYRNVTCERKDRQDRVKAYRCEVEEPMPATSQSCELLCRQDCVVSTFSHWSSCDSSCQSANQTRTRNVIVPPRHRGSHCPDLSEMTVCDKCTHSYTYKLSDWLPCSPIVASYLKDIKSHHLIGYQIRDISCLNTRGMMSSLSFCAKKFPNTVLRKHRSCVMSQDCQVSAWSSMHPHNTSCIGYDGQIKHGYMIRTRQIIQMPLGDGEPCPSAIIDYIKLSKEDSSLLRPCNRGKWILSSWSLCQSVPGYNHCGTGVRTRRAICVEAGDDGTERPVDDAHCPVPKPVVAQSCTMECNWDCSVSQWSTWTTCQETNCDRSDMVKRETSRPLGKRFRTREVLTLPGPAGAACPHLSETQACDPEQCYIWNITLGPCEATTRGGCGDGTQLRKAICLNKSGEKVRDRFCHESLHTEQNWANCYVPCPEDCVLSEWGHWSSCPDACLMQDGTRSRQRHILAYHSPGRRNRQCPTTGALIQTEPCPVLTDCSTYKWDVSTWGPCQLNIQNARIQCGPGTQTRAIECYTTMGVKAPDKCEESTQPRTSQPCSIDCPIDCHVTEWSDWSGCGIECLPAEARQMYPTQIRRRFILQYPQNGGLTCPSDLREEQPCTNLPVCQTHYYETTDWSDCILPPVVPLCGQGLRARNISCYQNDDKGTRQVPVMTCLEKLGSMPDTTEVCYIPCESECQFSSWSQWTLCGPQCEKNRFRIRRLLDESKNTPKCHDIELYPRDEHQECVCDSVQSVLIGGWSDCIIQSNLGDEMIFASMSLKSISARHRRTNETGVTGLGPQTYCGQGKRYMAFLCQNSYPNTAGTPVCTGEDYQEENCTVPCPVDCKTSPWSTWSQCSSACGAGVQKRERQIVAMPQNGGRRCPFLYGQKEMQTKVCHVECNQNVWKTEDWDPCIPSESRTCGDGTHRRIVRCIALSSEGTEIMTVDETFCNSHNKPQAIKPCSLPCPGECVLSEWSDWTTCTQPCTGKETQTRIRNVLRMPASYAVTQTCVPQTEERLCEKWKNCFEYSWEFSDWTSCLINYGEAECGVGHKERFAFCRNENGERVDSIICQEIFGHVTEPMVVSCEIPCDNDCLLSDWSDWTACSTTCGLGFTKRRRTILQNPIGSGRKCPEKLDQSKPCFRKGCYRWFVSEWSQCILQQGACGSGEQERNISCLNDEGRLVVPSLCDIDPEILIMQTSRPCHVPCPGECKLSEWSSWSDCFISCEDYDQGFTVGIQARSRAVLAYPSSNNPPCDGTLWEDKACHAEYCSQFQWVTSEWDKITRSREVYCSRNDALVVVGGCDDSRIPSRKLTCTNPVCVTPAICEDLNECGCPPGEGHELQPISDTAVTCIMNTSAAHDLAAAGIQIAKSPNIWMYAVIAIGTLFVIAVTAALYNMCELFRTGPRPRRKGQHSHEGSTTGVLDSINGLQARTNTDQNMESPRSENIYKQLNHVPPETAHVFMETVISSSPAPGPHPNIRPPLSDDPEDIPGLETPASSLNNVSASAATISTPITPTDTDMKRSRAVGVMSQVGFVTSNHSDHLSTLPPRHNRRYKHIRYLLPAGLVKCFACNDNSSTCMLDEQHDQSHATRVSANEGQLIPLTQADSSTVGETCREEVGTSNSSAFLSHNCLLPHSHDLRPTKLDILKHDRVLDDSRMTDQLHIPLIDEIDSEIKRISPEMPKLFPASSSISHDSPRVPSQSGRDSLSELQLVPSTVTPDKYDVRSQGKMTVGHPNKSSEYAAQSLQYHRPKNFTPSPKSAPPLSLWSQSGKRLQLPAEASTISPSPSSLSPLLDLQYTNKASLTNRYNMHDPTNPRASGMELANVGDLPPAPSRIPVFPHFAQPVDVYTCSLCAQSHQKTSPIVHPNRHSRTDLLSPSSYSSDSGYNFNRKYESPSKSASYHNRLTTVKALISPIYRGKSEHGKGGDRTNLDAASKISSSTSLPENLITSTRNYSTIPPLIQKISQDSGHSTTPRSQTTSLDDYSLENPTDTVSRQSRRSGLYPFHGQASLESGHSSPASGLCDSCKRDLEKSKVLPFLLGASDSTSQASNICGMETSV